MDKSVILIQTNQMCYYKQSNTILPSKFPIPNAEGIIPNTVDAAYEKYVPVIEQHREHITVKVSSIEYSMMEIHSIKWIILETATGYQKKDPNPGEKPAAAFAVTEPVLAAYEYSKLHGLWKAEA